MTEEIRAVPKLGTRNQRPGSKFCLSMRLPEWSQIINVDKWTFLSISNTEVVFELWFL